MQFQEFNKKHEVIIEIDLNPIEDTKDKKDGDIVECDPKVRTIKRYHNIGDDQYILLEFSRDFILDLAEEIRKIEGSIIDAKYYSLPF